MRRLVHPGPMPGPQPASPVRPVQRTALADRLHLPAYAWLYRQTGQRLDEHRHHELELNVVVAGQGTCLVAPEQGPERLVELCPGRLLWLAPGTVHGLVRQGGGLAMWVAWWRPGLMQRLARETPGMESLLRCGWLAAEVVRGVLVDLDRQFQGIPRHQEGLLRGTALLTTAWFSAWDATSGAATCRDDHLHPAVASALRLLEVQPDLDVGTLARRSGLSPNRLSTLFADQTGHRLAAWRTHLRLERFLAAYRHGHGDGMLRAALAAGFGSYGAFHRAFTARFACGPRTWYDARAGGA